MLCANVEALIELFGLSGPCSCLAAQSRSSRRCRCPRCLGARPNATCRRQKTGWAGRSFPATGLRRPTARTSTRCACWARTSLRTSWWGWRTSTPNKVGLSMKMFRYKFSQSTYQAWARSSEGILPRQNSGRVEYRVGLDVKNRDRELDLRNIFNSILQSSKVE